MSRIVKIIAEREGEALEKKEVTKQTNYDDCGVFTIVFSHSATKNY
jgi:Ulp1 family protease